MNENVLAKRYARGFIGAAIPAEKADDLLRQMRSLALAATEVRGFVLALADERVDLSRRLSVAESSAAILKLGSSATNLLRLLVRNRRAQLIALVAHTAVEMISEREGKSRADLFVADESFSGEIKSGVEKMLSDAIDRDVSCDVKVDPGLIGGFKVKLGDVIYDASLAGRLSRMETALRAKGKES